MPCLQKNPEIGEFQTRSRRPVGRRSHESVTDLKPALLAVLLDPRGAQTGKAMLIDRILPGEEFFDGQCVAAASLLEGEQTAAHSRDNLCLATDHPTLGARRRQ